MLDRPRGRRRARFSGQNLVFRRYCCRGSDQGHGPGHVAHRALPAAPRPSLEHRARRASGAHARRLARLGRHLRLHGAGGAARGEGQGRRRGARPADLGLLRRPDRGRRAARRRRAQVPRRRAAALLPRRAPRAARRRRGLGHAVDDRVDRQSREPVGPSSCACRPASTPASATSSSPRRRTASCSSRGPGATRVFELEDLATAGEIVLSAETAAAVEPGWLGEERDGARVMQPARAGREHDPAAAGRRRARASTSTCPRRSARTSPSRAARPSTAR